MFTRSATVRFGVVLDISSDMVGCAVVESKKNAPPNILWHTTAPVSFTTSQKDSDQLEAIGRALTTVAQQLPTGISESSAPVNQLQSLQVTVAAPWSYTISRSVAYDQQNEFTLSEDFVHDITIQTSKVVMDRFYSENEVDPTLLPETSRGIISISAHGYKIPTISNQSVTSIRATHVNTVVDAKILPLVQVVADVLPGCAVQITSRALASYYYLQHAIPHLSDVSILHSTAESTELCVVRDGVLQHCNHAREGTGTLIRAIAIYTSRPVTEIATRLRDFITGSHKEETAQTVTEHESLLQILLRHTGDSSLPPATLYTVSNPPIPSEYNELLKSAATQVRSTPVHFQQLSETIPDEYADIPLLYAAARFFHTTPQQTFFMYT